MASLAAPPGRALQEADLRSWLASMPSDVEAWKAQRAGVVLLLHSRHRDGAADLAIVPLRHPSATAAFCPIALAWESQPKPCFGLFSSASSCRGRNSRRLCVFSLLLISQL